MMNDAESMKTDEQPAIKIPQVASSGNDLYKFDIEEQRKFLRSKVWESSNQYFNNVHISCSALMKAVNHCISGGNIEVMGLMLGYVKEGSFVVLDTFALPVEGTETR